LGDLVNRGPQSLQVLRLVKSMGANARTVLGNHDLHLLAHHFDSTRPTHKGDTLRQVLEAPDCEALVQWLLEQPLAIQIKDSGHLLIHAGLVPQWSVAVALDEAAAAMQALRRQPRDFLADMYGNKPDRWEPTLARMERWRFTVNVLTRLRYCTADGTINLQLKDAPSRVAPPWLPWFDQAHRLSHGQRIIFGHWSTLGLVTRLDIVALDTGCVWGGALTAVKLDDAEEPPIQVAGLKIGNGEL
jgi:bis(5'-nucleosyl)-tetraphosphatase (symmetrical)